MSITVKGNSSHPAHPKKERNAQIQRFSRGVLPLDSKLKVFSGILLLTAGLSACGTNDAIDNGNNTRPIGYYSNDADRNAGLDNTVLLQKCLKT